ncbi:unnamed protein product [Rhizoctonia solani]|uniref:Uncharacterized protein n=1 Tax=Rhizoctonia solani TaxID=456999 RepID=A0A8H3DJV7_9AGAM|nr:unnamed protein product [Rhizoctonia solani]
MSSATLESIKVVSKCLIAFQKGVKAQDQDDVASFTLLSMLASDAKRSCFDDPEGFKSAKKSWAQSDSLWENTQISSDTVLSRFVLDKVNDSKESRDAVEQAIEAVGKPRNGGALQVLGNSAVGPRQLAFLAGHTTADSNGNETVQLCGVFGNVSKSGGNFLESILKQGDAIRVCNLKIILSEAIASMFRDAVHQKLGHHYQDDVISVDF